MSQHQFGRLRVVVVEPNNDVRPALEGFFSRAGATVQALTSLDEALRVISGFSPNFIIVCATLLNDNRLDFLQDLHALRSSTGGLLQVLILSNVGRPDTHSRFRHAGFPAILQKPFAPRDLVNAISKLGLLEEPDLTQ